MSPKFQKLYSKVGRPSIAPERLLRSLLLQIFYSVRSERMLIEQLEYNLLFRWFVGMGMDETWKIVRSGYLTATRHMNNFSAQCPSKSGANFKQCGQANPAYWTSSAQNKKRRTRVKSLVVRGDSSFLARHCRYKCETRKNEAAMVTASSSRAIYRSRVPRAFTRPVRAW